MRQEEDSGSNRGQPSRSGLVPPHSLEAEQSVLGALLLDQEAWDRIAGVIQARDFYSQQHAMIFEAVAKLSARSTPVDLLTVLDTLKSADELEKAGGESSLYEMVNNTPSSANVEAYASIVRERSILRQLLAAGQHIARDALKGEGEDSQALLDDAERKIFEIAEHGSHDEGPVDISTVLSKATDRIDQLFHAGSDITGLSTGFSDLDQMTTGLQDGDLVIVAGRPSMGKTAFSMNIAEHAAISSGKPVLIFSLEMPADMLAMRMISSLGRVNSHKVRTGKLSEEDWPRLTSAISMLSESKMFIDDTAAISPTEMRARARRVARRHGDLGLIVVDYLQLMRVKGTTENRTNEISEISRMLKALAKEMNVPVVALSQLNRGLEQRQDRRPVMSDLRESGAIEQDADVIAFIYRDEVYNEQSPDKGSAEIIIGKQRNGPIGKVRLTFLGEYTRFENFAMDRVPSEYE